MFWQSVVVSDFRLYSLNPMRSVIDLSNAIENTFVPCPDRLYEELPWHELRSATVVTVNTRCSTSKALEYAKTKALRVPDSQGHITGRIEFGQSVVINRRS